MAALVGRFSRPWRRLAARIVMALPFINAAVPPGSAASTDEAPAIERLETIRARLLERDRQGAADERAQLAQWYNFPNWPNWPNWRNYWRNY